MRRVALVVGLALGACGGSKTPAPRVTPATSTPVDARAAACGAKGLPARPFGPTPLDVAIPSGPVLRVELDDERLRGAVPLRSGAPIDDAELGHTVKSVWATGLVEDVRVDARAEKGGVVLHVRTAPRPTVHALFLDTPDGFGESDAERVLGLRAGAPLDRDALAGKIRAVAEAFAEEGYLDAAVSVTGVATPAGLDVCARMAPGPRAVVREVRVVGARTLGEAEVRARFGDEGAKVNAVGGFLRETALEVGALRVEALGYEHGLLDLEAEPRAERMEGGYRIVLTLREGLVYKIGSVRCVGHPAIVAACPDAVRRLPRGTVMQGSVVRAVLADLAARAKDADVTPETVLDQDAARVDLLFRATPR